MRQRKQNTRCMVSHEQKYEHRVDLNLSKLVDVPVAAGSNVSCPISSVDTEVRHTSRFMFAPDADNWLREHTLRHIALLGWFKL